ncbi:hypothetical protein C3L33_11509, partial [Rhododendron williamsianum]
MEHFHSMVSACEFMDLEFKGPNYTWSNNQEGDSNIRIRLDRALATVAWRNLFPLAQVMHETRVGSDHCPLVVFFEVKLKKVPFQFKFESKWSTHPECGQVVSRVWNENQGGSALYGLVQKLKKCKGELLKWSRLVFGKDKLKLKLLQEKLKAIQATPFSADSFKEERDIIKEMEMLLLREEMALHQRSRINWLLYGDKNSAFFHATINQRRQRNQVIRLKSSMGDWIEDDEGINELIQEFFSNLFTHFGRRDFSEVLHSGSFQNEGFLNSLDGDAGADFGDRRCGVCGPAVISRFKEVIELHGLQGKVSVSACSHIGGHKYAGNVIIFGSNIKGEVTGHWYGYVTPDDVPVLLEHHIGRGEIVDGLWRGQMGLSEDDQRRFQELRLQPDGETNDGRSTKEATQTNGSQVEVNGCCQANESFPCCQNDSIPEKTDNTDLNEREAKLAAEKKSNKRRISRRNSGKKGTCTRRVCTMPTWIESWEREDTYAALAVIGAALSVAFAYRCYKELR